MSTLRDPFGGAEEGGPDLGAGFWGHDPERRRLHDAEHHRVPWQHWGPYLAERQWGTVREDYSADGDPWTYLTHDHARSRAYRWGEDGILGISDSRGLLFFALAFWNEADPILKERLFGLTNHEGNHGEDVKEYYYFLDNTPTHSYMKAIYRYPQRPFPYELLLEANRRRTRDEPEYELLDTGIFEDDRYLDITVEYAKADPNDIFIRVTATNHGPEPAPLHVLPHLWFRNTWAWGSHPKKAELREEATGHQRERVVHARQYRLGEYWLHCQGDPPLLFTENETNSERLWGAPNASPFVKDGIGRCVVEGETGAVNPAGNGTKVAAHYQAIIAPGGQWTTLLRLADRRVDDPFRDAEHLFDQRRTEADEFYAVYAPEDMPDDERQVQRQAFAGLLWSKQFYRYDVDVWLNGDPAGPPPPPGRERIRNARWRHLNNADVMVMPDTWEYPWYAAWDLAFHCIPLVMVDPELAKQQLVMLLREWFMHPNGQAPAYEWAFDDVNPPVHAWAAWRVYKIEKRVWGEADRDFLERVFHKLLLNFTWWVNREDTEGRNVFQGGFLGLDNIGVFDRTKELPNGGQLEQADGTAWMGMFCLNMLAIALELAMVDRSYEDVAIKFFEHFLFIAGALNDIGGSGISLWDEQDEFFYDVMRLPDGTQTPLKLRTMVGLIPLLAVETIEPAVMAALPEFRGAMDWFLEHRMDLAGLVSRWREPGMGERHLLALVRGHRMNRLFQRMLDPAEFLSDYGVRSLSRFHRDHPYSITIAGQEHTVRYDPGESSVPLFGGNSNWRGPVWFPLNYLLIEAIQKFHHYYGDRFQVEHPTGSGRRMSLRQVADDLSRRLTTLFLLDESGRRPCFGGDDRFAADPRWRDHLLFHEYFHGDTGAGLGACHQTGWTALVAKLLEQTGGRD